MLHGAQGAPVSPARGALRKATAPYVQREPGQRQSYSVEIQRYERGERAGLAGEDETGL
jgi:hypothetical protein